MRHRRLLLPIAAAFALLTAQGCKKGARAKRPPPLAPMAPQTFGPADADAPAPPTAGGSPLDPGAEAERGLPGGDSIAPAPVDTDRRDRAVLLVHGLAMDGSSMGAIRAYLRAQGVAEVHAIDLPGRGVTVTMKKCAKAVAARVRELAARGIRRVDMVGHSMGGLVIREYLRSQAVDGVRVPVMITVGTPNHGNGTVASLLEKIGAKSTTSEMAANSDFIETINRAALPPGTRGYGLYSRHDGVVRPAESCRLPGGENFALDVGRLGAHMALGFHPTSLAKIHELVVGGGGASAAD